MQAYIVAGGYSRKYHYGKTPHGSSLMSWITATTEILKNPEKKYGRWKKFASMPSPRFLFSGVSLPNGHFMVTGEDSSLWWTELWNTS